MVSFRCRVVANRVEKFVNGNVLTICSVVCCWPFSQIVDLAKPNMCMCLLDVGIEVTILLWYKNVYITTDTTTAMATAATMCTAMATTTTTTTTTTQRLGTL